MSLPLRPALALGLLLAASAPANPIVAPDPWPPSRPKRPPGPRLPGPERCLITLGTRDGRESVLYVPERFLTADAGHEAVPPGGPARPPLAAVVTGLALAAAVSLAGVGLARSRHRRALVGGAACALACVLLVNSSCSPVPRHVDPADETADEAGRPDDQPPDGRVLLVKPGPREVQGAATRLRLEVGEDLRGRVGKVGR